MQSRRISARRCALALVIALPACVTAQEQERRDPPGSLSIDAEAAERALERTLVTTGNLVLPKGVMEVTTRAAFTRLSSETPVFHVAGDQVLLASSTTRRSIVDGAVAIKAGAGWETQLELEVPYRAVHEEQIVTSGGSVLSDAGESGTGFGDLRLGIARALNSGGGEHASLVGRVEWDSASGQERDGALSLGGFGYEEIEASLSATRRQDPLVFTGRLSWRVAAEKNGIRPGESLGLSLGAFLAASPETSLRLQLDQYFVGRAEVDGHGVAGTDQVVAMLGLGASSIIGRGKFLDLTVAAGITDEAPDYSLMVSWSTRLAPRW